MKRSMASLCWILLLVVGEAAPVLHKVISMLKSMKETGGKIKGIVCPMVGGQHGIVMMLQWIILSESFLIPSWQLTYSTYLYGIGKSSGPSYLSRGLCYFPAG